MGPQMGPKIAEKSDLDPPSRPRDAKGRPEASREQFVEPFGAHFGTAILESFLTPTTPLVFVALVACLLPVSPAAKASQLLRVGGCPR